MERINDTVYMDGTSRTRPEKHAGYPHKRLKPHTRKIPEEKLRELVLEYITSCGSNWICKENVAVALRVRPKDLDKLFMQLNREGILSRACHDHAHDTNRNPVFSGSASGWVSDYYTILNKERTNGTE